LKDYFSIQMHCFAIIFFDQPIAVGSK